jgi:hypothetical protein
MGRREDWDRSRAIEWCVTGDVKRSGVIFETERTRLGEETAL